MHHATPHPSPEAAIERRGRNSSACLYCDGACQSPTECFAIAGAKRFAAVDALARMSGLRLELGELIVDGELRRVFKFLDENGLLVLENAKPDRDLLMWLVARAEGAMIAPAALESSAASRSVRRL